MAMRRRLKEDISQVSEKTADECKDTNTSTQDLNDDGEIDQTSKLCIFR